MFRLLNGEDLMIDVGREGAREVKTSDKVSIVRNQVNGLLFPEAENTGRGGGSGKTAITNTE